MKNIFSYIIIVSVGAMAGCKVMQPAPLPAVKPMPQQFAEKAGETDSANLVFKNIFSDVRLNNFIATALKDNTDLNIALQRIEMAHARLAQRKGAFLPSVNGVVSGAADKYGDYTLNGVGNFDTNLSPNINKDQKIPVSPTTDLFVGLTSTWEIDLWGKLRHLKKAAQAELLATEKGKQLLITSLVATLAEGYYTLLGLDAELKIVRKNIELQKQAVEIVEAQKVGGRANELAVQQFRAQLLNTRGIEFRIMQQRVQVENELNAIAGSYPKHIDRDTSLPESVAVAIEAGLPASLLSARPDVQQAEYELQMMKENVQAARAAFLPSLTLNPYVAFNAFTPSLLFKDGSLAYGVAGGLTAPLFQQRQLKAQFVMANAASKESVYNYQQKLLNAYSEVVTNMNAVDNYKQAHALKLQEVQELYAAVTSARELYLTGYATYLEVITAQKNVLEAELALNEQKKNIYISLIQLYRSLGGGWQ
ncbi:TolC family protein [Niastella sp. OAS944]|uniref:TolC family protein n=1 Tax=Niastella sp. OAS944 TaxID=2664089 RepID=UPI00347D6FF3|nr:NodT family efflux transporter outer membrane factor (OMF) lipoprotein [Chitinophagaceae bacterium OAS944]